MNLHIQTWAHEAHTNLSRGVLFLFFDPTPAGGESSPLNKPLLTSLCTSRSLLRNQHFYFSVTHGVTLWFVLALLPWRQFKRGLRNINTCVKQSGMSKGQRSVLGSEVCHLKAFDLNWCKFEFPCLFYFLTCALSFQSRIKHAFTKTKGWKQERMSKNLMKFVYISSQLWCMPLHCQTLFLKNFLIFFSFSTQL